MFYFKSLSTANNGRRRALCGKNCKKAAELVAASNENEGLLDFFTHRLSHDRDILSLLIKPKSVKIIFYKAETREMWLAGVNRDDEKLRPSRLLCKDTILAKSL